MTAQPPRNYTTLAAAIVVAAVIIAATVFVALGSSITVTKTVPEARVTTETATMTSISTEIMTVTSPENASLLADCLTSQQVNVPWFGTLVTKSSSPAVICVQLYEFNSTSPITVNTTGLISIQGSQPIQGGGRGSVSGTGNFSVVASQSQVVLGGPTNAGEGTVVAYAITAKPGASGTYSISLGGFELGSEPDSCASNGELVAGNGQPDYALIGGCITYSTTSAQSFTIPGVGYNILSNSVYFRIISVTNSTQ